MKSFGNMGVSMRTRFNFIEDNVSRILVVRPIGDLPSKAFADHVIEAYSSVEQPWTYNRIIDLRRHHVYVTNDDRAGIAKAWAGITAGIQYQAFVAMLMRDTFEKLRLPEISVDFPNETVCLFNEYQDAVSWLIGSSSNGQMPTNSAFSVGGHVGAIGLNASSGLSL